MLISLVCLGVDLSAYRDNLGFCGLFFHMQSRLVVAEVVSVSENVKIFFYYNSNSKTIGKAFYSNGINNLA